MGGERFDVLAYAASAHGSHRPELTGVGDPLPEPVRDLLRFVRRRMADTTRWLSLVLVTPTHKDARSTAFLSAWAYERHWIADALTALAGEDAPAPERARRGDRFAPLTESVVANLHGTALTAVQMAERVVDQLLTDRLLARAAALAPAAVAADLERIRSVLARQQPFFLETATERLAASPRARRLTRMRLSARAWPLGAERDAEEARRALRLLGEGDPGWAVELDARIDELPGLAGLRLMQRTAANPGRAPLRSTVRTAAALGRLAADLTRRKG